MAKARPSAEAVRRARNAATMKRITADREFFRISCVWLDFVEFFYGGYLVRYEFYYGQIVRRDPPGERYRYLSDEDFRTLHALASELMDGVRNGLREANKRRKAASEKRKAANKKKSAQSGQGKLDL